MNRISIIVLVYNTSKYLEKCLNSLIKQDINGIKYEIIVVNDGSTDKSEKIILKYQKKYTNIIKYVKKENGGPSSARNEGLKYANGEYILFVDSDDYVDKKLLSTFFTFNANYDLFIYGYSEVYENNKNISKQNCILIHDILSGKDALNIFFEQKAVRGYVWNKIFKAEIIKKNGILFNENVRYIEDLLFVIEYISKCDKVFFSPKILYNYLQRSGSLINSNFNVNKLSALIAYEKMMEIVSNININYLPTIKYFYYELNYELSVRIRISNHSDEFKKEYKILKQNMKDSLQYFIFKKVKLKYKIKAIIKYLFYEIILMKYEGKNEKN